MTPQHRIVLGMHGLAGSGKDTAVSHLVADGSFVRLALGDELKRALYLLNPDICKVVDGGSRVFGLQALVDWFGWDVVKQEPAVRGLLQRMGSDAGWMFHGEELWTSRLDVLIAELPTTQNIIVTDIRMPHEARWLRALGGRVVTVTRRAARELLTPAQRSHVSESGIGVPDHLVENEGSVDDLHRAIDAVVASLVAEG